MNRTKLISGTAGLTLVTLLVAFFIGRDRRAAAIAEAETNCWKAYYRMDAMTVRSELTTLFDDIFEFEIEDAEFIAERFSHAAMLFEVGGAPPKQIIGILEEGYARAAQRLGADWDPAAAADAEYAWWRARRTPGEDSPEQVGEAIAALYSILLGNENEAIREAGFLRAKAAHLRDEGARNPAGTPWSEIQEMLEESYLHLVKGL